MYEPDKALAAFLRELPKTETHLHLEGALPFHFVQEMNPALYRNSPASWDSHYKFSSFAQFENELIAMSAPFHHSPEQYYRSAKEIFSRLYAEEQVRYVECSFASGVLEFMGGDGAANAEAIKQAAPAGMEVRVFMGIHHNGLTAKSRGFIEDAVHWKYLDGVDLHGEETLPLEPWASEVWQAFRAAGKRTKAHAGEFCGAEFVERVMEQLGVDRIQHGVRSIEDRILVERLADEGIVLDICPISNVKLAVVERMELHPIRELFDAGVCCTVSTDDPLSFGNRLSQEYAALHQALGFTYRELGQLARNGFLTSDMDPAQRRMYLDTIDSVVARHSGVKGE